MPMIEVNQDLLAQVVQAAFDATLGRRDALRWQAAIVRARHILDSNPFLHVSDDGTLLMLSDSGELYEGITDRHCPCAAFREGLPCKHRAAYRLLVRYNETSH